MKRKPFGVILITVMTVVSSCSSHYQMDNITRSRLLIDSKYDALPDAKSSNIIAPYKATVDKEMSPVVGQTARYMAPDRPEDLLSNLLPDILMWASPKFNENPDFAVYNIGGIRAAFAEGDVTYGDIIDVAPFENKICFLTLTGEKVMELFSQIAKRGGEGLSHGIKIGITPDLRLANATLNGIPIDKTRNYRIATLDYLAQGNDEMVAFKAGTDVVSPQGNENSVRFLIVDYFRNKTAQGEKIDASIEGRVYIEK